MPIKAHVSRVAIKSGFTEAESLEYFAQILKVPVSDLPKEANLIHEESKGSPIVMALVGGMLRDHENDPKQWKHYLTKLRRPETFTKQSWNIQYEHSSIAEAIRLSVDSLKVDLREKFFDLAIFDDGRGDSFP